MHLFLSGLWTILGNLGLTLLLELPFVLSVTRRRDYFLPALAGNLATNPAINFILLFLGKSIPVYLSVLAVLEAAAVGIEALIYRQCVGNCSRKKAFLLSLGANLLSFCLGTLLYSLL